MNACIPSLLQQGMLDGLVSGQTANFTRDIAYIGDEGVYYISLIVVQFV
jgi:hypothetical protein